METQEQRSRILERLDQEIAFYRRNAGRQMRWYRTIKVLQIGVSFLIPTATITLPGEGARITAGVLGAFLGAVESFNQVFGFQRHWLRWRNAERALVRESELFSSSAGPYGVGDEPKSVTALLTERLEDIMSREREEWAADSLSSDQRQPAQQKNGA